MDERWAQLSDEFKALMNQSAETFRFPKGTRIYTQGEGPPGWLYRIEKGEVELRLSIDTEEVVIGYKRPGDLLGWFVVFPDKPNPFSAVTAMDTVAVGYPQAFLVEAFQTNVGLAGAVARAMDENIFMIHKHLAAENRVRTIERVETFPFRKRVSEIMQTPAVACGGEVTANQAARIMNDKKVTSLVITGEEGGAAGVVTEKDFIRTILANGENMRVPVARIMTTPVIGVSPGAYVYQAMGKMRRHNIRHLPVLESGKAIGMITMRDLMLLRSHETLNLISQIEMERDPYKLGHIRKKAVPIYRAMIEESVPPLDIARLISHINEEVHRRALSLTIDEMGPPPLDFLFFVTGSHGREENHLRTDQDHGMILADYPPGRHNEIDAYFAPFADRITDKLALAGLPYCEGGVMCRNPVWRKTLSEWKSQLSIWMRGTDKTRVRYLTLLADIAPIYGHETYLFDLKEAFMSAIGENANVLRSLYDEAAEHKAPLGLFNRIITERTAAHQGQINIKKSGVIFMVEALRILAIKNGVEAIGTMDRLAALTGMGVINREDEEFLSASYSRLFEFLLKTQLNKIAKGEEPDEYMKVYLLSERDTELLTRAFESVKRLQSILHGEFGNIFF